MKKATKSERYKYVRYDPDNSILGGKNTKANLQKAICLPWVAAPAHENNNGGIRMRSAITKRFATEREAALFVDQWFLSHGREPVNILVRKP